MNDWPGSQMREGEVTLSSARPPIIIDVRCGGLVGGPICTYGDSEPSGGSHSTSQVSHSQRQDALNASWTAGDGKLYLQLLAALPVWRCDYCSDWGRGYTYLQALQYKYWHEKACKIRKDKGI